MAARLLHNSKSVVVFNSGLRTLAQNLRNFSSSTKWGRNPLGTTEEATKPNDSNTTTIWPDPNLGFLAPCDKRLPLPGNVGLGSHLTSQLQPQPKQQSLVKDDSDILTCQLPMERHITILSQFFNPDQLEEEELEVSLNMPAVGDVLECVAQECPQLVRKDFADLFPGVDITTGDFTVITLSQKTQNDMSTWSESVELEREELMLYYVIAAEEICNHLKDLGYWADFIDPSSGRPYLGPYTSAAMFETDERYRHLGFTIEDLGCCKVISHRVWGTSVFVGCLFTNAPANSLHIKSIIERHSGKKPLQKN